MSVKIDGGPRTPPSGIASRDRAINATEHRSGGRRHRRAPTFTCLGADDVTTDLLLEATRCREGVRRCFALRSASLAVRPAKSILMGARRGKSTWSSPTGPSGPGRTDSRPRSGAHRPSTAMRDRRLVSVSHRRRSPRPRHPLEPAAPRYRSRPSVTGRELGLGPRPPGAANFPASMRIIRPGQALAVSRRLMLDEDRRPSANLTSGSWKVVGANARRARHYLIPIG